MPLFKKKLNDTPKIIEQKGPTWEEIVEANQEVDIYSMEVVVDRVTGGVVGTLRVEDDINYPIFKKGDFISIYRVNRIKPKDFVLYQSHEQYFIRRIIKFVEDDIYVAGDHEHEYHIIKKKDILGKVISRQRKLKVLSFSVTPKKKLYTFKKVNLSKFRLGNRVTDYEQEALAESLELASTMAKSNTTEVEKKDYKYDFDLDSDLQSFLNPDTLVLELRKAEGGTGETEEDIQYVDEDGNPITKEEYEALYGSDEDVQYVDEEGNPITKEEYEALQAESDDNIQYVDEEGNPITKEEYEALQADLEEENDAEADSNTESK
ncbi:MAG: hypothetical protein IKP12_04155 [Acholeplasmatales bacterium]|nr:hypothetical protein [Acholeplasmatales bacterium]